MSRKGVLCKFFLHRACLKGEHCEFSHDFKDPPNNICTFYQRGACAYGKHCRYEHVKISRSQPSASSSSATTYPSQYILSGSTPAIRLGGGALGGIEHIPGANSGVSATNESFLPLERLAWTKNDEDGDVSEFSSMRDSRSLNPADHPICSFAAAGNCPRGDACPHIHGDLCPTCGKNCLHPFRPQEREEHLNMCMQRQKHLDSLKQSQEIECSVCLERVLSKSTVSERKFGILSECDHPFCISCIRNWRNSSPSSGNSTLRACPICRKLSYFVIPSVIWYSTQEEKQEIVDNYKAKLRSIDCKHFDFGNGTCPFGTSCFYKHAYRDGCLEEVKLRHLGNEQGETVIAKDIRLSDFLGDMHIR